MVLCRLEWGQLGLARQGWVGLNCGWLDLVGISLLVPSWIQVYWIGLGWSQLLRALRRCAYQGWAGLGSTGMDSARFGRNVPVLGLLRVGRAPLAWSEWVR